MSKRNLDQDVDEGGEVEVNGNGNGGGGVDGQDVALDISEIHVLEKFTQANGGNRYKRTKRERIEVEDNDEDEEEEDGMDTLAPALAGIIEKIELTNFMCHDHFEVEFGPQINFIIGHNGSGKSAILTAISVGLGAKANETNRGSSLKSLIKNGSSSGRISITIKNEGPSSYKREIFGKKIIIQRILKREGTNNYYIKSETGKTVSNKKTDLDSILSRFSITVNNPMAVLTQDDAKSFLATASDREKYKFFMAGTKTDDTINNYSMTEEEVEKVKEKLLELKEEIGELKADDQKAKSIYDKYQASEHYQEMKNLIEGKYLWVQVVENEEKIKATNDKIQQFKEEIQAAQNHIENNKIEIKNCEEKKTKITEDFANHNNEVTVLEGQRMEIRDQLSKAAANLKAMENEKKLIEVDMKKNDEKITKFKEDAKVEQTRIDKINGGSHEELEKQKNEISAESSLTEVKAKNIRNEKEVYKEEAATRIVEIREQIETEKAKEINITNRLRSIQSSKAKELDAYGHQIYNILDAVERDPGFKSKPIGPLGRYISIKQGEEKWSQLLEATLKSALEAFVVDNSHDFNRLSTLFRRHKHTANIVIRKSEIFDYSQKSASADFKRVMDVLEISNKYVECILVDMCRVNRILLIEDRSKAESIARSNNRNVHSILVPFDFRSGNSIRINQYGGLQEELIRVRIKEKKIQQEDDEKIKAFDRELKALVNKQSQYDRHIFEINNKLAESANTGHLESLKEQIETLTQQNMVNRQTIEEANFENQKHYLEYQKLDESFAEINRKIQKLKNSNDKVNNKLTEYQSLIDTKINEINHYNKSINKRNVLIEKCEQYIEGTSTEIGKLIANAEDHCSREDADLKEEDTLDTIRKQRERISQEVAQIEQELGMSSEEIINRMQIARLKFNQAKEKISQASILQNNLRQSLTDRLTTFLEVRDNLCIKVNESFQSSLQLRNFTGKIEFDHKEQRLKMLVSTKDGAELRSVESFSGGEKSFAQIALLLAIWQQMNTKIRGLDEFDVFMDQINRRLCLKLILQKLRGYASKSQTIFITPLDIAGLDGVDQGDVHIHRIVDPRRSVNSNNP
ncbi:hypothetical protein PACTADRAFT_81147 [Pachysolen tannophilus NRRL Y-2460]|uniref:Rad50/SbcC-type AAA domain-containing protein n=1 Tax=Pachysolen tannophilus NRRL Y-2460 TaxID=669874 RepID=A0A1E4TS57_PACTA|nr:hypothetical protein PACTADRAFT_81147 [Pachysolen tannophilus NRRL Y-2460]